MEKFRQLSLLSKEKENNEILAPFDYDELEENIRMDVGNPFAIDNSRVTNNDQEGTINPNRESYDRSIAPNKETNPRT